MRPKVHIPVSLSLGVLFYTYTGSSLGGMVCVASGILVDIDHIIEYAINFGWNGFATIEEAYRFYGGLETYKRGERPKKLYLFFHSIELAVIFWILYTHTGNVIVLGFFVGYSTHLILDFVGNLWNGRHLSYFLCFNVYRSLKQD